MVGECDVISVVTELMVESGFGSRYDGGARVLVIAAREHIHHTSRVVATDALLTLFLTTLTLRYLNTPPCLFGDPADGLEPAMRFPVNNTFFSIKRCTVRVCEPDVALEGRRRVLCLCSA